MTGCEQQRTLALTGWNVGFLPGGNVVVRATTNEADTGRLITDIEAGTLAAIAPQPVLGPASSRTTR